MEKYKIKPLDIVKLPSGTLAFVREVGKYGDASIDFIGEDKNHDKLAWWNPEELEYIDNMASILARNLAAYVGNNREIALKIYPK